MVSFSYMIPVETDCLNCVGQKVSRFRIRRINNEFSVSLDEQKPQTKAAPHLTPPIIWHDAHKHHHKPFLFLQGAAGEEGPPGNDGLIGQRVRLKDSAVCTVSMNNTVFTDNCSVLPGRPR